MLRFFDASTRCVPGPHTPSCVVPEETYTFKPRVAEPVVSMYRLTHKVPSKARKAWRHAAAAAFDGHPRDSVAFLDEALAIDPDYADALHMRGVYAYQDKDFNRAAVWLHRAATLDDGNPAYLADAAAGQLAIHSPVDAERYARASLRLNPEQPRALEVLNRLKP